MKWDWAKQWLDGFRPHKCPECGAESDPAETKCPRCGKDFEATPFMRSSRNLTFLGAPKELALSLGGYVLLMFVSLVVSLAVTALAQSVLWQGGFTGAALSEALSKYLSSSSALALVNYSSYAIFLLLLALFLWKDWPRILKSFRSKRVLLGFAFGVGLFLLSLALSSLLAIWAEPSQNQETNDLMTKDFPVLVFLMTVFVVPIAEEAIYRLGLFSFLKRVSPILAYVLGAILFAMVHMHDLSSANEWLNFPVYLLGGAVLCAAYDHSGIGGSYLAHATYNALALTINLIGIFA